jgi:hypothetical protein
MLLACVVLCRHISIGVGLLSLFGYYRYFIYDMQRDIVNMCFLLSFTFIFPCIAPVDRMSILYCCSSAIWSEVRVQFV